MRKILTVAAPLLALLISSCQPEGERPFLRFGGMKGNVERVEYTYAELRPGQNDSIVKTVTVAYDPAGRPVSDVTTDGKGALDTGLEYSYDGSGFKEMVQTDGPSGKEYRTDRSTDPYARYDRIHRTYDRDGRLTSEILVRGEREIYVYHRYDRKGDVVCTRSGDTYADPDGTVVKYRYKAYDDAGNWTECISRSGDTRTRITRTISYRDDR